MSAPSGLSAPTLPPLGLVMPKARRENFSVAARVLPAAIREHLLAIYAVARLIDDVGDESSGDRIALLGAVERELDRAYEGTATHPVMRRLTPAVRAHALPRDLFARLIEANRRDQRVRRYPTYHDLLDYCSLSANPVGRLVLHVFDAVTPDRCVLADSICTALQIVEHCQDVGEDLDRGRIYLPLEDLERFACREADLRIVPARACVRELIGFEVARARQLLRAGEPLLHSLRGWARIAVAGYVAGGHAAADAIVRTGGDVLAQRTRGRRRDRLRWTAELVWKARRR